MTPRPSFLARLALCSALAPALASAQEAGDPDQHNYAETEEELDGFLWQRDRELLHKGSPLSVAGLEQQGNSFRARTPALAQTDARVAVVDQQELHERKLAMYANRASFHTPPSSPRPSARTAGPGRSAAGAQPGPAGDGASSTPSIGWVLGIVALALLFIAFWRARRYAAE